MIVHRLNATVMNDYQELLSSYVAQSNELQVQGPNVKNDIAVYAWSINHRLD